MILKLQQNDLLNNNLFCVPIKNIEGVAMRANYYFRLFGELKNSY